MTDLSCVTRTPAPLAALAGMVLRLLIRAGSWGRFPRGGEWDPTRIRLSLGRFLTLGLEFQLAGDILRTAVAPTFSEIGQLAAIAAIRTVLNYFLGKEIEKEREEVERVAPS